jgi:hypothetical protein
VGDEHGRTGAEFTAELDQMQRVIDGELHNAILHFTAISDQVHSAFDADHRQFQPA